MNDRNYKRNKRKSKIIFFSLFAAFAVAAGIYLWRGVNILQITHYTIISKKLPNSFDGYRIVQLTDLHSKTFGRGNKRLIDKINGLRPDLIVVTGDMLDSEKDDGKVFEQLAAVLAKKYPVYCISGNHEEQVMLHDDSGIFTDFKAKLTTGGVKYIDDQKVELMRGGGHIELYGLTMPLGYYSSEKTLKSEGYDFTKEKITQRIGSADPNKFNLLLVHSPFFFDGYAEWGADLSLAGHVHGGVIRLPFIGGVISPDLTFFPKYDAGLFKSGEAQMIVGRGLGTTIMPIRILNQPEIVSITLKAA